jgi:hypothetical protein
MSDAPETVESLCLHLRKMADTAMYQIDADRLCRAADLCASAQSRVDQETALPAVQPAPVTVEDMPSDGTCKKCGCAPTNAEGRCHTCAEEMVDEPKRIWIGQHGGEAQ